MKRITSFLLAVLLAFSAGISTAQPTLTGAGKIVAAAGGITIGNVASEQIGTECTSCVMTATLAVNTGSTIVAFIVTEGGGDPSAVSDGSAYTKRRSQQRASFADYYQTVWSRENVSSGTYTVTITPAASSKVSVVLVELRGVATSSFVAGTVASNNNDGSDPRELTSGASVTSGHVVLVGISTSYGSTNNFDPQGSFTSSAGLKLTTGTIGGEAGWSLGVMYWVATSSGSVTAGVNTTGSDAELTLTSWTP